MANPTVKTFTQLIQGFAAAVQSAASGLVDFTAGSLELAIGEAVSSVALWLQGLILVLLQTTRAATSTASDLDTWMADYGLFRLAAGYAVGTVTFGRFNPAGQGLVPVGSTVQTADGSQQYVVIADPTNGAYNAGLGGYTLANSVATVNVPVQALAAGSAGNAVAAFVTQITAAIPGIDTVTNAAPFAGGADAETDTALRARFIAYLGSLSKATVAAVQQAVLSLQPGASCVIVENLNYAGAPMLGYFYVIADDGTGAPPGNFLLSAAAAINAVRGLSIQFDVFAPVIVTANVSMVLSVAAGYSKPTVASAVQAALTAYINGLPGGTALNYSKLAQVAYEASPGVTNVGSVLLNSGTADLACTAKQVIKAGTIAPTAP